jgi:hypothetical protein
MAVTVKAAVSEMRQCERRGISTAHMNLLAPWSGYIERDDEGSSWYTHPPQCMTFKSALKRVPLKTVQLGYSKSAATRTAMPFDPIDQ